MEEIWKDIPGYETLYQVSNLGRVKRLTYRNQYTTFEKEGILKPYKKKTGYLRVYLTKNSKRKCFLVHRLVALAFIPTSDYNLEVNHIDFNRQNNAVDNLEWVSHKDNVKYSTINGRYKNNRRVIV